MIRKDQNVLKIEFLKPYCETDPGIICSYRLIFLWPGRKAWKRKPSLCHSSSSTKKLQQHQVWGDYSSFPMTTPGELILQRSKTEMNLQFLQRTALMLINQSSVQKHIA